MRPFPSLRAALLTAVILPLVVAGGVTGYVALESLEGWAQRRLEREVGVIARAVRLPLGRSLEQGRQGTVQQVLESVFETDRVYGAYVYDADGAPIATIGQEEDEDAERLSQIAQEGDRVGEYGRVAGREVYSYFVPITNSGSQIIGLLQVTQRRSEIRAELARLRLQGLGLLGGSMALIVTLVLYGHHGAVGRHLRRLTESMETIQKGARGHRPAADGPREIAVLSSGISAMLDSIDQAEDELEARRAAQRELEKRLGWTEKLAAIGRLGAGVAHELGAPLSVILGTAQRAERQPGLTEAQKQSLREIRSEVGRMERIVRQLLDLGRTAAPPCDLVNAASLVRTACTLVETEREEGKGIVALDGPEDGPEFQGDRTQLETVLSNLVRNAVQAAPDGPVRVRWDVEGDRVVFVVEDGGSGVVEGDRGDLFDPFFTTKAVGEGTGLGLSIAHAIVGRHGGQIHVGDSELGGASFTVELPLRHQPAPRPAHAGEA